MSQVPITLHVNDYRELQRSLTNIVKAFEEVHPGLMIYGIDLVRSHNIGDTLPGLISAHPDIRLCLP